MNNEAPTPDPPDDEARRDYEARLVAYLTAADWTDDEISKQTAMSGLRVRRRRALAQENGYLTKPECHLSEEDVQSFELFPVARELLDLLHSKLRTRILQRITIVSDTTPAIPRSRKRADPNRTVLNQIGLAAAFRIRQWLSYGTIRFIGCAWGATVQAVVHSLPHWIQPGQFSTIPEVVPLSGDLMHPEEKDALALASSTLAWEFATALGGPRGPQQYFWAPAYLPIEAFSGTEEEVKAQQAVVAKFIKSLPSYRDIFGPPREGERLVDRLDMILCGCGAAPSETSEQDRPWFNFTAHIPENQRDRWLQAACGDLCGNFLSRADATRADGELLEAINANVFVAPLSVFERCAERAHLDSRAAGPLVVAAGKSKAETIEAICRQNLASEILVDSALAAELRRRLDAPATGERSSTSA
jgi:DNA-binding transcriptional regulator LsrR (DeoR family)